MRQLVSYPDSKILPLTRKSSFKLYSCDHLFQKTLMAVSIGIYCTITYMKLNAFFSPLFFNSSFEIILFLSRFCFVPFMCISFLGSRWCGKASTGRVWSELFVFTKIISTVSNRQFLYDCYVPHAFGAILLFTPIFVISALLKTHTSRSSCPVTLMSCAYGEQNCDTDTCELHLK